ncbi:hypothetical protein LC612_24155 [Nostoc sp. CHAB 5834]|nr:hypothetical protein [Nostoc sp. CHAB 5834]
MTNTQINSLNSSTDDKSQKSEVVAIATSTQAVINPDVKLNLSDYVTSIPISQKTAGEIEAEAARQLAKSAQQRENTRSKLAMFLAKVFGFSLGATFLLIGITAFNPNTDKALVKDLISQTITPQVTLLSFALGFYFGSNKDS